jgi:hypothetical protein
MESLEKKLEAIENVAKKFRKDETIKVSIENGKLYLHGKRSYIPKGYFNAIDEERDTLLSYGVLKHQGEIITETAWVGNTSYLGLDEWPICKTLKEVAREIA